MLKLIIKKHFCFLLLIGLFSVPISTWAKSTGNLKRFTVVIDAGHGGKDPGALGKEDVREKDIVLAIALKVGKYIENSCEDVRVIYTRNTDEFIPLHERAEIANRNKADLFISIHANTNPYNSKIEGTETYAMGLHTSNGNLEVAKKENAVITFEKDYSSHYEGYNPNSAESFIIFSLVQNTHLTQSLNFASFVQSHVKEEAQRNDRGVKQAGFLVLWRTTMPAVLIETGYISNETEERFLASEKGQNDLAYGIFKAFKEYKSHIESKSLFLAAADSTKVSHNRSTRNKHLPDNSGELRRSTDSLKANPDTNKSTLIVSNKKIEDQTGENEDTGSIRFRVQILASIKPVPLTAKNFKGLSNVEEMKVEKVYKYFVGNTANYHKALVLYRDIKKKYYPDAFIIACDNDKIIPLHEALNKIKN